MTTKKVTTSTKSKKTKKDLMWAGASQLLGAPAKGKEENERRLVVMVAEVLKVSPFGVNILGNQPYINNLGLKQKLAQYNKDAQFTYKWERIAEDDEQKAVVFVNIVDKAGKELLKSPVIGEASNMTMSMRTLHGYQNHLAQTRGENRAVRALLGVKIHEDMIREIGKRMSKVDDEQKALLTEVASAGTVSAEEINHRDRDQVLFETAMERLDDIKDNEELLKQALGKLSQMNISQLKVEQLRSAIKVYLNALRPIKKGKKS